MLKEKQNRKGHPRGCVGEAAYGDMLYMVREGRKDSLIQCGDLRD